MYEIHVAMTIHAPLERVFAVVSDHEHFLGGPGVTCRLAREGREQRNGIGAVREVEFGGNVFTEEITAFDAPRGFEYVVRKLLNERGRPVPMLHERGWLEFTSEGAATRVVWRSRFKITIPIVGWILERVVGPRAANGFRQLLDRAKAELEASRSHAREGARI
jgi:hypothetical protein